MPPHIGSAKIIGNGKVSDGNICHNILNVLSLLGLEINAEYKFRTLYNEPPSEDMATFHHLLAINTENH